MTVKGPQWHYQRYLIILAAVFFAITILCSTATSQSYGLYSITGKVVDRNGNAVPGAFVELIMNGSILKIANNPQISGDRQTKPFGSFNFTGLAPGEYTILVEITTPASGKFNGSKSVSVVSRTVDVNVTLAGYKYAYSTPTPIPTMQTAGENTITITPEPLASISSVTTDSVSGDLFKSDTVLLMIGLFSFIILGGFCVLMISSRRGRSERYLDHRSLKNYNSTPNDPGPASSADADRGTQGYEEEIADMIKIKKEGKVTDTEYYKRMDGLANKYSVNYSKIMSDISKGMKDK